VRWDELSGLSSGASSVLANPARRHLGNNLFAFCGSHSPEGVHMRHTLQTKKQHGQVLIVILAFAAILGALLSLYNTTQLVTQKQQLNDAADAAAYSGAVVLAQGLNTRPIPTGPCWPTVP
jgi:DNA-binding transcriptional regulator WhiA